MKNFIFISPQFPKSYYQFCKALKEEGFNVLGIADCNYEELSNELRNSLTEYYKVDSMQDYNEMYKAVAYYAFKYGKIDFIESNNEFYLELDAKLREDFNVNTGKKGNEILAFKSKEEEKKYYKKAGVLTARYHIPTTISEALKFINIVNYPVIVKPDNGVGASATYKINNYDELKRFYNNLPESKYIMEEFVDGDLISFDGVSDKNANPIFYSNEVFPKQIMDIVNNGNDCFYFCNNNVPSDLLEIGARTLKAFDAKYRYFHLEFFRLKNDKPGLGIKGDIIGLEVNMRAPGGYTPDLINFANSVDSYKIWAQAMNGSTTLKLRNESLYCAYVGRRNGYNYRVSSNDILNEYHNQICMHDVMPDILAGAMGNEFFAAKFEIKEKMEEFVSKALKK